MLRASLSGLTKFTNFFSSCTNCAQNTHFRYRIIVDFVNMNVDFENDRKSCYIHAVDMHNSIIYVVNYMHVM